MMQPSLGIGNPPEAPQLNFDAAYAQYEKDEQKKGKEPLPLPEFIKMVTMAMQVQGGGKAGLLG